MPCSATMRPSPSGKKFKGLSTRTPSSVTPFAGVTIISPVPPWTSGSVVICTLAKADGKPVAAALDVEFPKLYNTSPGKLSQVPFKSFKLDNVHGSESLSTAISNRVSPAVSVTGFVNSTVLSCLGMIMLAPT